MRNTIGFTGEIEIEEGDYIYFFDVDYNAELIGDTDVDYYTVANAVIKIRGEKNHSETEEVTELTDEELKRFESKVIELTETEALNDFWN